MQSGVDKIFSGHEQALTVHAKRMELIGANVANADTPGFKARDIDFRQVLANAAEEGAGLRRSHSAHLALNGASDGMGAAVGYRIPTQPTMDGNTVDSHHEKTELAEASLRYESTLTFLTRKISGIKEALRVQV